MTEEGYCFDRGGKRLWKLGTGCGSALSMQFWSDRLYIVTTDGTFACIDVSVSAITAAQTGNIPHSVSIPTPQTPALTVATSLETVSDASQGAIVECFRQGNQLRIRVVSAGYNPNWMVQFPRDIRQEGSRYLVEEIRKAKQGGFYRAYGDIKKLV